MDGITAYALSKKVAASAVSGVKSMSVDGQTLTINTKDSGVLKMVFPTPSDGRSVTDIDVNANNQIVFTMSDGSEIISGKIPTVKGDKGDPFKYSDFTPEQLDSLKGSDGFSPSAKIEKVGDTATITITDKDGTTTATIKDGQDGQGSGTADVPIEKIKVNGELQTPVNKVVDITVPSIEGLTKDTDLATVAKSGNYEDLENKPVIPSLDGYAKTTEIPSKVSQLENDSNYLSSIPEEYVTETELSAKGYLTEHQDISGKVDKVEGKSLISDTEITRLATVDNYDDTDIRTELANKADATAIPSKVSELTNDSNYQTAEQVNSTVTTEIAKVVADAPEDLNTLKEMSDWIAGHEDDASAMNSAISDNKTAITALQTGKADKSEIPTVPTNVSEFINDAGYLTEHQDISNLVVKEEGKGLSSNDYTSEEKTRLGGVGTSQGRNLIPYPLTDRTTNGITYTVQSDGSVVANGTASAEDNAYYNFAYKTLKLGDTSYTLSCEGLPKSVYVYVYDETISKAVANVSDVPVAKTFVGDSTHIYSLSINVGKGISVSDLAIKPILEMGTIAHAYEPISESNVNLKAEIDKISTAQGRNLISYPYYNGTSYELNGITYTVNEADGTITVNGTATKESDFRLINPYEPSGRKTLELGQTYTLSDSVNQPNGIGYQAPVYFQFVRIDTTKNDFNYGISTNYGNMTWTASDANLLQYGIRIVVRSGVTVDNVVMKPMLEIGAIAHMYEPTTESNISLKSTIDTKADKSEVCVNMLNPTLQTSTLNGITCTNNGDGTYTFTGTATGTATFIVKDMVDFVKKHINKDIRLVGCPKNGGVGNKYRLQFWGDPNSPVYDVGNGDNIHFKSIAKDANIAIIIDTGIHANNLVFKPMLTTNLNATYDDFVPYTGDGETLTHDVAEIKKDLGGLTFSASGTTLSITDGTHTWTLEANS